jgi:hypothetical protein
MQTYLFAYSFEGSRWVLEIQASSADEAKERLKRIPYATYTGELVAKLPAALGPLGIIAVWLRNAYQTLIHDSFWVRKV